jgi:hypothetical protein
VAKISGKLDIKTLKERQQQKVALQQRKVDEKRCQQAKRNAFTPSSGTRLGDIMPDNVKDLVKRTVNGQKKKPESKRSKAARKARSYRRGS